MEILSRKKRFVFFIILILLLAAAGVFLWQKYKRPDVGYVLTEEFVITEANGEKIIEYKKTGFKMRIPGDWEIDGFIARNGLLLTSPDFEFHEKVGPYSPPIPEKGCSITLDIAKEGTFGNSHVIQLVDACQTVGQDCNGDEIIEINGNRALKHVYFPENSVIPGKYVSVSIPKNKIVYYFETHLFSQDREKCEQEFDQILNTLEIRNNWFF